MQRATLDIHRSTDGDNSAQVVEKISSVPKRLLPSTGILRPVDFCPHAGVDE